MNDHKLKKLMQSPNKEGMRQHLKENGLFWDFMDKRSKYHNRAYGKAYDMVTYRFLDKKIGTDFDKAVRQLKSKPEYQHKHWFKTGVDCAIARVNDRSRYYDGSFYYYYYTDEQGLLRLYSGADRFKKVSHRWSPRKTGEQVMFYYVSGKVIEKRKGIHYFVLRDAYYKDFFRIVCGQPMVMHERVAPLYRQLNTQQLKLFNHVNNPQD